MASIPHSRYVGWINGGGVMKERFFFSQDDSCHWYMVPTELRETWNALRYSEVPDDIDTFIRLFGQYRCDGGINYITFADPQES